MSSAPINVIFDSSKNIIYILKCYSGSACLQHTYWSLYSTVNYDHKKKSKKPKTPKNADRLYDIEKYEPS